MIHTPHTAAEIGVTSAIGYASLAGAKIGYDIFRNYGEVAEKSKTDLHALKQMEDANGLTKPQKAYQRLAQKRRKEALFQRWVAGAWSGASSLAVFVGQFVMLVSPIGLGGLTVYGLGHAANAIRQIRGDLRSLKALKGSEPSPDLTMRRHYFRKKLKMHGRNLLSWGLFSVGLASLTGLSVGSMVAGAMTGTLPIVLMGVGFSALAVGVLGSVIFNNIITSPRFFPSLPKDISVENPPSSKDCREHLESVYGARKLIKAYRRKFLRERRLYGRAPLGRALVDGSRYLNKLGMYLTLGLVQSPFMKVKKNIKALSCDLYQGNPHHRWKILAALNGQDYQWQRTEQGRLKKGLELLAHHNPHGAPIMKIFAHRLTAGGASLNHGRLGPFEKVPCLTWRRTLKASLPSYVRTDDDREDLVALANYKPCCSGAFEAGNFLESLTAYAKDNPTLDRHLLQTLERSIDQYLVYQVRSDLKRELAFWAEYRAGF